MGDITREHTSRMTEEDDHISYSSDDDIDSTDDITMSCSNDATMEERSLGRHGVVSMGGGGGGNNYRCKEKRPLRLNINSRERRRMHDLNDALDDLRSVIPYAHSPSVRKLSKIATYFLPRTTY